MAPRPLSLLLYSLLRIAIGAGLLFSRVVAPTTWLLPSILQHDYMPLGLILLLGITQVGWC